MGRGSKGKQRQNQVDGGSKSKLRALECGCLERAESSPRVLMQGSDQAGKAVEYGEGS